MKDAQIDAALDKAVGVAHEVPPRLLEGIAASIEASIRPVRPLPPAWVLRSALVLVVTAVALLGAGRAGFQGIEALGSGARVVIFGTLGLLAWVAAGQTVHEWLPGSRQRIGPAALIAIATVSLLALFTLLFHDYRVEHFVSAGVNCLVTGLLHAIPAALLGWWCVRRGLALNPVAAGLAAGMLAGIAGVTVLELHCTNFEALHLLVWHTMVIPMSAALGAALGWAVAASARAGPGRPS